MKKLGISLATLLALATSACADSPTASAARAGAALNGAYVNPGYDREGTGTGWTGEEIAAGAEKPGRMTTSEARNPGFLGSGH